MIDVPLTHGLDQPDAAVRVLGLDVELMDGEIGVHSVVGEGSTFWLEIPFVASTNPETSITDNHVLLLSGEDTADIIRPSLTYWQVNFDWVRTPTRALSQLLQARDDRGCVPVRHP